MEVSIHPAVIGDNHVGYENDIKESTTSTAGGRMFFHLLGVFAQWEREEITERVNASVLTRAKLGKSINGKSPYGYEWKDRKLVIQPEEAAIRRKAYELFLANRRKGNVARVLNA